MNPDVERWFFIDQTLNQLFHDYGLARSIGRQILKDALARERQGYHAARGVIVHSRWAANSVAKDYGVPLERIHVVVPGANIDSEFYTSWEGRHRHPDEPRPPGPLRLVFVGKDWKRKGLDVLISALQIARSSGSDLTLSVIGCDPDSVSPHMRQTEGVEWAGFIDKTNNSRLFLEMVGGCDIGCLLSTAEAGGIAYREYHALGLVVIGTQVGGTPDHMIPGCSIPLQPNITAEQLADILMSLTSDSPRFAELRCLAWKNRRLALWEHSLEELTKIWPHQVESS